MGWLWSSNDGSDKRLASTDPSQSSSVSLTEEQRQRIFGRPGPASKQTPTRDELADVELNAFLKSLEASDPRKTPSVTPSNAVSTPQTAEEPTNHDRIRADGTLDISPDAILPRTMSCRQAFDQAFYCQSLGGKFNDIYRHGHLKSCSEQWGAFWFCMRIRTMPDLDRQRLTKEHYATRDERRRKEFGSSEDIWEVRTTAVQRAFDRDPDADDYGGLQAKQ